MLQEALARRNGLPNVEDLADFPRIGQRVNCYAGSGNPRIVEQVLGEPYPNVAPQLRLRQRGKRRRRISASGRGF